MSKESTGSISFAGLLAIAFIVLKLTKVINWSWWWVLAPIWIPTAITVVILIIYGIILLKKRNQVKKKIDELINNGQEPLQLKSKWQQRLGDMQAAQKKKDA